MNAYKRLALLWKEQPEEFRKIVHERLQVWRREDATVRVERPLRIDRARTLGYKAKQGFVIVRQRVNRGGRKRPDIDHPRRSKHSRQKKILAMNYQQVAEKRVAIKYPNLEVLNSYYVGQDGQHYWYEIILVDPDNSCIKADKNVSWTKDNRGRPYRGLTSAAKKSRGLLHKGRGAEKIRPSLRANDRRSK